MAKKNVTLSYPYPDEAAAYPEKADQLARILCKLPRRVVYRVGVLTPDGPFYLTKTKRWWSGLSDQPADLWMFTAEEAAAFSEDLQLAGFVVCSYAV